MDNDLNQGFILGEWRVEPLNGGLVKAGHRQHLEPKVMDVLLCLARAGGETVSREQLLSEVWAGVVVSEEVLTRAVSELRSLLGDTAREKRFVGTVPKRGYRLLLQPQPLQESVPAPVAPQRVEAASEVAAQTTPPAELIPAAAPSPAAAQVQPTPVPGMTAANPAPLPWYALLLQTLNSVVSTIGSVLIYCVLIGCGLVAALVLIAVMNDDEATVAIHHGDEKAEMLLDQVFDRVEERLNGAPSTAKGMTPAKTIAVLPFVSLSGDSNQAFFADGLSEDIRNALITIPEIRVVARTSSRVFKDQAKDVREIGRELDAHVLVEGTVRIQGDRVRVTVQLTDTEEGYPLWAGSYDRDMADAFAIQREIAQEVAQKLELQLTPHPQASVNAGAYEKYLLGRHYWHQRTPESLRKAADEFERAIEIQPDYALAYSGLADAYSFTVIYGEMGGDPDKGRVDKESEEVQKAQRYVDKALQLAPRLAEAYASQGIIHELKGEYGLARRAHERAVQLKPAYSMARMWLGNALMTDGELSGAYNQYSAALDNDPLHPKIQHNYLSVLQKQGRYDEALRLGEQFFNQSRDESLLKMQLYGLYSAGRYDEVLDFALRHNFPAEKQNYVNATVVDALIRLGQFEDAGNLLEQLRPELDSWRLALLDMAMAMRTNNNGAVEAIAKRVEAIHPEDMWANQARCENYEAAGLARADYWRGLGAYKRGDYAGASDYFESAHDNGGGCWQEPDIELSVLLYRADVAGLLNQSALKRQLLREIEKRIQNMRAQGWGHMSLQASELVYFILSNQPVKLATTLQRMLQQDLQPLGLAAIDPMLTRYLTFADTKAQFAVLRKSFDEMQTRGSQKQLAKFGI
ncbi:tetratricopeptide repeat protein [Pseudomaricurvus alkylphenolicus]|uniref:winged helix-turn-helix domain-containing protein n=1 Tax=Pseudomaricurvus alkylphenolicus TaxID=1306991 RepID=UPI0014239BB7|nr:winged helix-turn-helix domain-containing protein [Pseudomaricurvus alkylphenolicus]NIB42711.1 tetratricopeptide repeat protein [Pseudomaricurvus alkylphenolicus]